jgi:hypothetical protein
MGVINIPFSRSITDSYPQIVHENNEWWIKCDPSSIDSLSKASHDDAPGRGWRDRNAASEPKDKTDLNDKTRPDPPVEQEKIIGNKFEVKNVFKSAEYKLFLIIR